MNILKGNLKSRIVAIFFLCFHCFCNATQADIELQLSEILTIENATQQNEKLFQLVENPQLSTLQSLTVHTHIANNYFQTDKTGFAIEHMQVAQQIANKNQLLEEEAKAYKLLGIYNYFKGNLVQSLNAYESSLDYYAKQDEPIKQANLLNNIGLVHSAAGKYSEALLAYQEAEPLYKQFGSEIDQNDILSNIGGLYFHLGVYERAIEVFKKVYEKRKELHDDYGLANASSDLGLVYFRVRDYAKSEKYTRQAYDYFYKNNHIYDVGAELLHLARLLSEIEDYTQAEQYAQQCVDLKPENLRYLSGCYYELAYANFSKGDISSAKKHLKMSDDVVHKGNLDEQKNVNLYLNMLISAYQNDHLTALQQGRDYNNYKRDSYNTKLYEALARFESDTLEQKIDQLEQSSALQQLQLSQSQQQLWFIIIIMVLFITLMTFYYRRRTERQIKNDLASMVRQRTQELEETTVALQKANNIKNQFLANMSHEIRTPLTAILGLSEDSFNGELDEADLRSDMLVIHRNSEHLLQLVNDILDLSKIVAGKFDIDLQRINLNDSLINIEQTFKLQASRKNILFNVQHDFKMPFYIKTDRLRLHQILFNLCANAIKFTSKGKVSVITELQNSTLLIHVKDTGIGMNAHQLEHIFERFNQVNNRISRRFGGTGLGLFLSNKLAKLINASITVTSAPEVGSTFTLRLPYQAEVSLPAEQANHSEPAKLMALPKNIFSGKILLADDYTDNRHLIARILKHTGLDVIEAQNGIQALELYYQHNPDVIFLDIQMPEKNGIETLQELIALGCKKPIYAMSANVMAHEIEHYKTLGFYGYIQKPINRQDLMDSLAQHFNEQKNVKSVKQAPSIPHKKDNKTTQQSSANTRENQVDLSDLVDLFKKELVNELELIKQNLNSESFQEILDICHKMSGAAAVFGFQNLADICQKIDIAGKQQNYNQFPQLIKTLTQEIERID